MPFHKKVFKEIERGAGRLEREARRIDKQALAETKRVTNRLERESRRIDRKADEEARRIANDPTVQAGVTLGVTVFNPAAGAAVAAGFAANNVRRFEDPSFPQLPPLPAVSPTRIDPISEFQSRSLLQRRLQRGRAGSNPTGGRGVPFSAFDIRKASLLDTLG